MGDEVDERFTCFEDAEELVHTEMRSAVEELLDNEYPDTIADWPDQVRSAAEAYVAKNGPVQVYVYRHREVTEKHISVQVECLLEKLVDEFNESELANPEEHDECAGACAAAKTHVEAAVRAFYGKVHVWSCEKVRTETLTVDEVVALFKENA